MGIVLWTLLWLAGEAAGEAVRWVMAPAWRAFVRLLSGPVVLLLWGGAAASMLAAWNMAPPDSAAAVWGRIVLFIGAPVLAIMATVEWRDRGRLPTRRRGSAY